MTPSRTGLLGTHAEVTLPCTQLIRLDSVACTPHSATSIDRRASEVLRVVVLARLGGPPPAVRLGDPTLCTGLPGATVGRPHDALNHTACDFMHVGGRWRPHGRLGLFACVHRFGPTHVRRWGRLWRVPGHLLGPEFALRHAPPGAAPAAHARPALGGRLGRVAR